MTTTSQTSSSRTASPPARARTHRPRSSFSTAPVATRTISFPLGQSLLPGAAILSPRGAVRERGAARFFARLAEGVFDLEDLALRTQQLIRFVNGAVAKYELDDSRIIAVGFSNGANIAASVMLTGPPIFSAAVLFRAMVPFEPTTPSEARRHARASELRRMGSDRHAGASAAAAVTPHRSRRRGDDQLLQRGPRATRDDALDAAHWISACPEASSWREDSTSAIT